MKRSFILCLVILLAAASAALASANEQQSDTPRARRIYVGDRSYLGVELQEVTGDTATRLKLREPRGALVGVVSTDSPAHKAGLQKDDVVVAWNGDRLESAAELARHLRETPAGRTVRLGIIREGREIQADVTLVERNEYVSRFRYRPETRNVYRAGREGIRFSRRGPLGIEMLGLSSQLAEYLGLSSPAGALVVYVHPDSPAAKAGLRAGDVILSVGGQSVETPLDTFRIVRASEEKSVEMRVMRDKKERTVTIQLDKEGKSGWLFAPDDFDDVVIAGPNVLVQPAHVAPLRIAPLRIRPLKITPTAMPRTTIAPVAIPRLRLSIPRVRILPCSFSI
jgi:C-terminal processing protease CtpA/Prc